jgi:PAS domain S-box-containing protein
MVPKKTATESGIGAVASGEEAILRRRVAELESELRELRRVIGGDKDRPVREALIHQAEKAAHLGSWFLNPETGEVKWSDEMFRILGFDPARDKASPDGFFKAIHPEDLPKAAKNLEHFRAFGRMIPIDLRVYRKDGTLREVHCDGTTVLADNGKALWRVGTVADVTEARRMSREASRSARFLLEAQSMAKVGGWVWESGSGLLDWSTQLGEIFGVEPGAAIDFETFRNRVHPDDRHLLEANNRRLRETGRCGPVEIRVIRPDGSLRHTLMQAKRIEDEPGLQPRMLGTVWDITERKQLEEQLRQSQKMEVVGRVAGGVAHDFNNLLTVITGNADLALEERDDERLRSIRNAADVGAALTRQLLAFSRQAVVKPAPLDLNEAIRGIVRIVDRLIGEDIAIKLELAQEPAVILADGAQVQQILLNLAVNARDAMAQGGDLVISTREAPGNPMNAGEPARWVELKVRDTGKGMDPATRERAFEPFFTTKEPGKGTGLGLSTIADIVAQMKGAIAIASEPNRGTAVTIRFPHSSAKVAPPPPSAKQGAGRGAESILLVEDNADLRELVRLFLASAGYKVLAVGRPGEAEALWKTEKEGIDLLITDMVMPEKSGKDLAKALLAAKPGLKTLFISGYSPSRNGFGEWGFLQKPFTRDELLCAVRALCDRGVDRGPDRASV